MSEESPPLLSDDEARRQREAALHALAQSQLGTAAEAPAASRAGTTAPAPVRRPRVAPARAARRPSPWLLLLSAVLVVAVIAGVVLYETGRLPGRGPGNKAAPATVVLAPSLQGLYCIHDVAWSPDGTQVAVIGYRDLCPSDDPGNYNYQAAVLHLYSATTGRLIKTILPDAAVLALSGIPLPSANVQPATSVSDTSKPVIDYTRVLWSPDGKRLALMFDINQWALAPYLVYTGLVLVNADGTGERAALWKEASPQVVTSYSAHPALRWDTTNMGVLPLPQQPHSGYLDSLPPAESYSWSAAGQLVPGTPLSTAPVQIAPSGNPDGGRSFTIWQSAYIAYLTLGISSASPVTTSAGVYVWDTGFPILSPDGFVAWSPDGRYLIDSISMLMIEHPQGRPDPTTSALQGLRMASAPTGPIHDPALQRLLISLSTGQGSNFVPTDNVVWSPNGRLLAAMSEFSPPFSSSGSSTPPKVSIYNCATGRLLASMAPEANAQVSVGQQPLTPYLSTSPLLRWSADGSHVLAYSSDLDTITIWGPGQLPRGS